MADDFPNIVPSSAPDTPDPEATAKEQALFTLAKSEDISDYAAEKEDQAKEAKGEEFEPTEDRLDRIKKAMEKAREDTQQARQTGPSELDQQLTEAEQAWQEQQAQEQWLEQQRTTTLDEARFTARAELLKEVNPTAWQQITDTMKLVDETLADPNQIDAFKRGLTKNRGPEALEAAWRLSQPTRNADGSVITPEMKIQYLASLSPQQLEQVLDHAQTYVQIERNIRQQYTNQPRRQTAAPPIIRTPSGGANPPRDMHTLAQKDNATDYIKMRMAQEKRAREG
jgi:hypothetical protein